MAKIGRNDPCPCGSGKKFKKCCDVKMKEGNSPQWQAGSPQVSVREEVAKIREAAISREARIMHLGVFVLFSTESGDAWLLELSDMDGVQVADQGKAIELEIEESAETIEINWSHRFMVKDGKFVATAYKDKTVTTHDNYPTHAIQSAIRKIRKKFTPEMLRSIHLSEEPARSEAG